MPVTITVPTITIPAAARLDLPGVAKALRPLLAPTLLVLGDAVGLGPFAPVLLGMAVKAVGTGTAA